MADQRIPFATHAETTVLGADEIVSDISIASLPVVQTPRELANFL